MDEVTAVASYRYGALYEGINSGTKDLGNAPVYGVDKDYFRVMGYTVQTGRLFEDQDWTNYTKGVILDTVAANTLLQVRIRSVRPWRSRASRLLLSVLLNRLMGLLRRLPI